VPAVTFRLLYGFVVLRHERREMVHFGVTAHPSAEWTAGQLTEAFPWDEAPKYLLRDRDVEPTERGQVVSLPRVGGLHHRYTRVA
jgi:hypothetical protein